MGEIQQNINQIQKRIEAAAQRSGRKKEDILLLAVSKTIDVERIKEAVACGLKELGENKVQEILEKYEPMGEEVKWHLIGHLQTNKVKYIIDKVKLIHSVESLKLAEEISKRAKKANKVMDILIEVNMAAEESKFGVAPEDTLSLIQKIALLDNICIRGLMTVAPFVENSEENRECFRRMKQLSVDINAEKIDNVYISYLNYLNHQTLLPFHLFPLYLKSFLLLNILLLKI